MSTDRPLATGSATGSSASHPDSSACFAPTASSRRRSVATPTASSCSTTWNGTGSPSSARPRATSRIASTSPRSSPAGSAASSSDARVTTSTWPAPGSQAMSVSSAASAGQSSAGSPGSCSAAPISSSSPYAGPSTVAAQQPHDHPVLAQHPAQLSRVRGRGVEQVQPRPGRPAQPRQLRLGIGDGWDDPHYLAIRATARILFIGVEGGDLVGLGQRRVVEDGVDQVVDGAAAAHHGLADVDEFGGAGAEDVHAEQLAVSGVTSSLSMP